MRSGAPSPALPYHDRVTRPLLIEHLRSNALRTGGPFTLASGAASDWYLDARQTTFSGEGAWLVGQAVLAVMEPEVEAVGGMTMGADPIAVATAMVGSTRGRPLVAFSIRKSEKGHGTGGRMVGPVRPGLKTAVVEDTTTTGAAMIEAVGAATEAGLEVVQAIALVDRSGGRVAEVFAARAIPYLALAVPEDLGVSS